MSAPKNKLSKFCKIVFDVLKYTHGKLFPCLKRTAWKVNKSWEKVFGKKLNFGWEKLTVDWVVRGEKSGKNER